MSTRLLSLLAFVLTLPQFVAAQEAEKHPIKLHRPAAKGDTYSYAAVGRLLEKINVSIDGETTETKDNAARFELASKVEVLAVDDLGLPSEMLITVYRFQKQRAQDELALDLTGRGTQITCKFTPEGDTFTIGEEPVSDELAEALSVVAMKLSSQNGETEDQVMGTTEPKAEGETWTLNADSITNALADNGFHTTSDKLRTEARLTSVTKPTGGAPEFLAIDVTIIGQGISPALPEGYATKSSTLTNKISRRYPTDLKQPCAGEEISFEIIAEAEGKEADSTVNLQLHLKQTLKARYKRIGA